MVKKSQNNKPTEEFETYQEFIQEVSSEDEVEEEDQPSTTPTLEKLADAKSKLESKNYKTGVRKLLKVFKGVVDGKEELELEVYEQVVTTALTELPRIFRKKLGKKLDKSKSWKALKREFKAFVAKVLSLMKQVKEPNLLDLIFKALIKIMKLMQLASEYTRNIMKNTAKLWGEASRPTKLVCFKFLRKCLVKDSFDKIETLKSMYLSFARNSRFMSWDNYETVDLLRNCFIDALTIDESASYQVVFTYLRQLSFYLSQVIKHPNTEKVKAVYNWTFLNSLLLLGQSILHNAFLKELTYPLVQISLGVLQVTNMPKFFPLKLHLIRLLISIQASTGTYIPGVTPHLLEMLESPFILKRSKTQRLKAYSFIVSIKASKEQLSSDVYKEGLVQEATDALIEHLASHAKNLAFPEIILPIRITLKRHSKNIKNPTIRGKILQALKVIQENADWLEKTRNKLQSTPVNPKQIQDEAPITTHSQRILHQRQEVIKSFLHSS